MSGSDDRVAEPTGQGSHVDDERANQGLDHLQTAAMELIHAARAFLDVAEDVVVDRDKVADIVRVFGSVADAAGRAARGEPLRGARRSDDGAGDDDGSGGVEHITVR